MPASAQLANSRSLLDLTPQQERFPVFADRMPLQLLAYIRLSRVSDPALFAKVRHQGCAKHVPAMPE